MKIINDDVDYIKFLGRQESQSISKPSDFMDEILARLNGDISTAGEKLPWNKTHGKVALRPGEVSIWAGINGHGKSALLGQVCAWNLHTPWLIASMEMKPSATMARMVRQMSGTREPADWYAKDLTEYTDNRLWIYDQVDTVPAERILGLCYYASQELGVKHVVIDSLMKCGIANDDYNGQKSFIDSLCWCAKTKMIHIHVVHHMRKGERESQMPDKFDIRGASEITDLVDNVFLIHRNKAKEAKIERGEESDELLMQPDCSLRVAKQRHGEWEGGIALWLHKDSMQFVPSPENRPMFYPRVSEGNQ